MTGYDKTTIKHIHEGRYAAEVEVTLHYDDEIDWSPTTGPDDSPRREYWAVVGVPPRWIGSCSGPLDCLP